MSKQNAAQKLAVELTALAKAATPGPWITDGDYVNEHNNVLYTYIASGRKRGGRIANTFANCLVKTDEQRRANAAFIAGANPKAVLVLAGEIERLNEEYDKAWRHNLNDKNNYQVLAAEVVRLGADRDHLKAFAVEMINASFEGGSFDGGDIQDIAVKHGLLRIEQREDECGEGCACREHGFPAECYRKTAILGAGPNEVSTPTTDNENVSRHEGGQT